MPKKANEWLSRIPNESKSSIKLIGRVSNREKKEKNLSKEQIWELKVGESLTGELEIRGFSSLQKINLRDAKGITRMEIKDCPNVEEIFTYDNQITEIVGVEKLVKLGRLEFAKNQVRKIDLSHNTNLTYLVCHGNEDLKVTGLENSKQLSFLNGGWSSKNKETFIFPSLRSFEKQVEKLVDNFSLQLVQEFRKLKVYLKKNEELVGWKEKIDHVLKLAETEEKFSEEIENKIRQLAKEITNNHENFTRVFEKNIKDKEENVKKAKENLSSAEEENKNKDKNWRTVLAKMFSERDFYDELERILSKIHEAAQIELDNSNEQWRVVQEILAEIAEISSNQKELESIQNQIQLPPK